MTPARARCWVVAAVLVLLPGLGRADDAPVPGATDPAPVEWTPIPRERWERYHEADADPDSLGVGLDRVDFTARLDGDTLVDGTLHATLRGKLVPSGPTLVPLGKTNLALSSMRTGEGPCTWGTLPDGRRVVAVESLDESLVADWTRRGERVGEAVEFDIRVPPAVVSTVRLRLARGLVASCEPGVVRPDPEAPNTWIVALGTESRCRVRIEPDRNVSRNDPIVLADSHLRFAVQPDGVRFRAEYDLRVVRGELTSLAMATPAEASVESVTMADRIPVTWRPVTTNDEPRVEIVLPDGVTTGSSRVTMTGTLPLDPGENWSVPTFDLVPDRRQRNARFAPSSGRIQVDIASPLRTEIVERTGLRRMGLVDDSPGDAQSLTFSVEDLDPRLVLNVSYPELAVRSASVTEVRTGGEVWSLRAALAWRARSGQTFELRFSVPSDWRITSVEPPAGSDTRLNGWRVTPGNAGRQIVTAELRSPLGPSTPRTLLVEARFDVDRATRSLLRARVRPLNTEVDDACVLLAGPANERPHVVTGANTRVIDRAELPATCAELLELLPNGEREFVVYEVRGPTSPLLVRRPLEDRLNAEVTLLSDDDGHFAEYQLSFHAADGAIAARWSAPGFPRTWTVVDEPGTRVRVDNDPADESTLRLSVLGARERVTVRGRAPIQIGAPIPIPVLTGRAVDQFRGTIRRDPTLDDRFTLQLPETGTQPAPNPDEWTYTEPPSEIVLVEGGGGETDGLATLELMTIVAPGTPILREAVYTTIPDGHEKRFDFAVPPGTDLVECRVDDARVQPLGAAPDFHVTYNDPTAPHRISIRYRDTARVAFPRGRIQFAPPSTPRRVLESRWRVAFDPALTAVSSEGGRFLERPFGASWSTRLFGPLRRGSGVPTFNPFARSTWGPAAHDDAEIPESTELSSLVPAGWSVVELDVPEPSSAASLLLSNRRGLGVIAWLVLVVCLACGAWLRARRQSGRTRFGIGFALTVLAVGWLVPHDVVVVLGGALAGTVAAFVLPRSLFRRADREVEPLERVGEGSTMSFRKVTTGLLVALLLGGTASSDDPPSGDRPPTIEGVVIPETTDGRPPAVVYVRPDILRRIEAFEAIAGHEDDYLVQSAIYELALAPDRPPRLIARYRIVPLGESRRISVEFPLRSSNPAGADPCLVNGESVPIELAPEPGNVVVTIDRSRFPDEVHDVRFELHPAVMLGESTSSTTVRIPAVADSRLVVSAIDGIETVWINAGEPVRISDTGMLESKLGPRTSATISWATSGPVAAPPRGARVAAIAVARVARTGTRLVARVRITPDKAVPVEGVTWTIPSSITPIEVTTPLDADVATRTLDDGGTAIVVTPQRAVPSDGLPVDFDFLVEPTEGEEVVLPSLAFLTPSSDGISFTRAADRLGFAAGTGWTIASVTAESGTSLGTLAVEALADSEVEWSVPSPDTARLVPRPEPLRITLAPRNPRIEATQRLEWRLGRAESSWTLAADIVVSEAPIFGHTINVPRRHVVDSVRLVADEIEQTVRWTRRGDELRISLDERVFGRHRLVVAGWAPQTDEPALGGIGLRDLVGGRIETIVRHDPTISVIPDPEGPMFEPVVTESDDGDSRATLGRFFRDATDVGPPGPTARVEPIEAERTLTTWTELERNPDDEANGGWTATTRIPLELSGPSARLRVRLPEDANLVHIDVDDDVRAFRSRGAEGAEITFVGPGDGTSDHEAVVVYSLPGSDEDLEAWSPAPLRSVLDPNRERSLLAVPPGWIPSNEAITFEPEQGSPNADRGAEFVVADADGRWSLRRDTARDAEGPRAMLEHRLELESSTVRGTTLVFLDGPSDVFELAWDGEPSIQSTIVNGTAVEVAPTGDRLLVPLDDRDQRTWIRVDWSVARTSSWPWSASRIPLPRGRDVVVDRTLIVVADALGRALRTSADVTRLAPLDFDLERLEGRIGTGERRTAPRAFVEESRARLDVLYDRIDGSTNGPDRDARRNRADALYEAVGRLVPRNGAWQPSPVRESFGEGVVVGRVDPDAESVSMGVVPNWFWILPAPLTLVIALWMLSRRPHVDEVTERFHDHVAVALLVTGLVWWLFWRWSAAGLLVIAAGLVVAVLERRRTREDRSEIIV